MQIQITVLSELSALNKVDYDVGFTHIDEHIVFELDGVFLSDKDTIPNAKVFDQVLERVWLKLDLEVSAAMLLCSLLIFVWNHKIIHNSFLYMLVFYKVDKGNLLLWFIRCQGFVGAA